MSVTLFVVQSLSCVQLFVTPWTAACQASLSIANSQSLLTLTSIELVMPSNHLILCRPLLLPSVFPSIRVFSSVSALHIRWPKDWSFSFSDSPSNEYSVLRLFIHDRLCDPMDCSLPGSSIHGILQARILEWVAISFSRMNVQG